MQSGLPFFRASLQVTSMHQTDTLSLGFADSSFWHEFCRQTRWIQEPLDQRSILNKQLISDRNGGFTIVVRQQGNRVFVSKQHSKKVVLLSIHPFWDTDVHSSLNRDTHTFISPITPSHCSGGTSMHPSSFTCLSRSKRLKSLSSTLSPFPGNLHSQSHSFGHYPPTLALSFPYS